MEEKELEEDAELRDEEALLEDDEALLKEEDSKLDDSLLRSEELIEELEGALELPVGKTIRPHETRENMVNASSELRIFFIFIIVRFARVKVDGKASRIFPKDILV